MSSVPYYLDRLAQRTGVILAFTPLLLILVQFSTVLMVYIFASGSIKLQESLQYINALMFLGGAGYTALHGDHVRVDLFYSKFSPRGKALVDVVGTLFLLLPFLILLWVTILPYAADSWASREGSVESGGLAYVYILKSTMVLFALTLSLQALSSFIRNIAFLYQPQNGSGKAPKQGGQA